jgi:hypothetical protein
MDILTGKEKIQERVDGAKARAGVLPEIDSVGVLANNTRCWPQLSLSALKHPWGYQIDFGFKGIFKEIPGWREQGFVRAHTLQLSY